jgi:hypothetical protein
MNRMLLMLASVAVAGCSSVSLKSPEQSGMQSIVQNPAPVSAAAPNRNPNLIVANDGAGPVVIQKVEVRPGVSSATVEKLGKRAGCTASAGAGLITQKGPIEVYRMQCDGGQMSGATFTAKCELRQCKPMR